MATKTELELTAMLKNAMRAKDKPMLAAIRMVRTKIMEKRTSKGAGELDDAAVVEVIGAYVKSLGSALEEFRANGTPEDDVNIVQLRTEMELLDRYLPKFLGEAETEALVDRTLAEHGITDPKMAGRATGLIMKGHKGEVDAGLVSRLIRAKLAPST